MSVDVYTRTAEHCRKISEANKIALLGNRNARGKKHSDESRRRHSEARKRLWQNPEYRKRMSERMMGNQNTLGWVPSIGWCKNQSERMLRNQHGLGSKGVASNALVFHHLDLCAGRLKPYAIIRLLHSDHIKLHHLINPRNSLENGYFVFGTTSLENQRKKQKQVLWSFFKVGKIKKLYDPVITLDMARGRGLKRRTIAGGKLSR